ncbi:transporter associated domain-containing protein [Halobacillus hunanensis]|uniref:transporter associated domain-containing protein n=1 Tax=Halobacillus hunanensis TaxID=578214 RepID=UPI002481C920|nr:transporter associated domain-containing protein [Halobacillus hunanensis]
MQDVNEFFKIELESEDVDTISGWVSNELIDVQKVSQLSHNPYHLKVVEIEDQQIVAITVWEE